MTKYVIIHYRMGEQSHQTVHRRGTPAWFLRQARRLVILVIGTTIILFGILLLVLPGPGLVIIAAGLVVLGVEFAWARRWLARIREEGADAWQWLKRHLKRKGIRIPDGRSNAGRKESR
ncbi:MAG: PGPGW domain-containing protein [Opitutales bacterium]